MSSCARKPAPTESPATSTASPAATAAAPTTAAEAQLANPASTHCVEQGGKLGIERRPDGAEFGVCFLEDNRQCEEWALLRGECPPTGAKITGYNTQAGRYCAITGGRYAVTGGSAENEQGTCTLAGGKVCNAEEYYRGTCNR